MRRILWTVHDEKGDDTKSPDHDRCRACHTSLGISLAVLLCTDGVVLLFSVFPFSHHSQRYDKIRTISSRIFLRVQGVRCDEGSTIVSI